MVKRLSALLLLYFGFGCQPFAVADVASVFTELSPEECKALPPPKEPTVEEGGLRCRGPAGYELLVLYADARASITVVAPDGKHHDLNYWDVITHHFSSLGPRAEWRMKKGGANKVPIALIVRVIANENPEQPSETTSYLAVAKVTKEQICVTDRIKADGKENVRARIAADVAAEKQCLGSAP